MIIDEICKGLKTSEQRVRSIANDTCLGFKIAEKAFIEKLLKNVAEELAHFNSSNNTIYIVGRSRVTLGVVFRDWEEWKTYYKYIDTARCGSSERISSFIKESLLKYGFPEDRIFDCNDNGSFRFILYSFGSTPLGTNHSRYYRK